MLGWRISVKVKGCLTFINATYFKIIEAESIVLLFLKKNKQTINLAIIWYAENCKWTKKSFPIYCTVYGFFAGIKVVCLLLPVGFVQAGEIR